MSRHPIVHTFDPNEIVSEFDGIDYDEEEDELSPEDREAMDQGTAEVRSALGTEANKVTTAQIQEALWHYYYDIDKSVTYLMKTFIAPAPKPAPKPKTAPEGMLGTLPLPPSHYKPLGGSGAEGHDRMMLEPNREDVVHLLSLAARFPIIQQPEIPTAWYFDDMPWLQVPQYRQTEFVPPHLPRGGLLGGGEPPKMSKLQALAAARKKKNEEKKEQDGASQTTKAVERLSISDDKEKENRRPPMGLAAKRQKLSDQSPQPSSLVQDVPGVEVSRLQSVSSTAQVESIETRDALPTHTQDDVVIVPTKKAAPSAFARTLLGSAPETSEAERPNTYAMPYTSSPSFFAQAFSEPSPDDIVFAAQAKAGKKSTATTKTAKKVSKDKDAPGNEIASDVAALKVDQTPPPKSKGLDVVKEFQNSKNKRSISFVVVGHVDAGKSTLMGRLLLELKFVEEHTINRYRKQAEKSGKQSFALAWVMDQRSEERERGVTIDIATNYFETENTNFTILDAPGHRDFIPNMIAGASQADLAILVIDANTGAFEKGLKGQTREHVLLLRSLGVQRLIIAVNKLDMVGWSQERYDEISDQVGGFLTGLGFQTKNVSFIPISGLNGGNLAKRTQHSAASWYSGPTLIEALEESEASTARLLKKPFRMAISEVFRSTQGTITIAGRVDSGSIQVGDSILVQPSGEQAYIKSIMVDTNMQDWAVAGQSISIALAEIDPIHIRVGDMLCPVSAPIQCSEAFTMKAMAFEHLLPMPIDLHRGRLHSPGHIQSISATLDKASGSVIKKKPRIVQPGGVARVVIKLESKIPLEAGQRVVIRSGGETIAAGLLE